MEIKKTPSVKTQQASPAKTAKTQPKTKTTGGKTQVKAKPAAAAPKDTFTPTTRSSHDDALKQMEELRDMSRKKPSGKASSVEVETGGPGKAGKTQPASTSKGGGPEVQTTPGKAGDIDVDVNSGKSGSIDTNTNTGKSGGIDTNTNTGKGGSIEIDGPANTNTGNGGHIETDVAPPRPRRIRNIDETAAKIAAQRRQQMDAEFAQSRNSPKSQPAEIEAPTTRTSKAPADLPDTPKAPEVPDAPDAKPKSSWITLTPKGQHAVSIVGLANSIYTTYDGAKKLGNGNYAEGGLQVTSGVMQTYASTDQFLETARNLKAFNAGEEIVEAGAQGLRGAKVLGAVAGVGMALVDAYSAAKAFEAGDNAQGAASAMSSAWGLASTAYPPAAAGALAHSLTRSVMEQKLYDGKTGDQLVTEQLAPAVNIFEDLEARNIDKNRARGLELFRQVAPRDLRRMAANPENRVQFANAIGGLLDKIGSTNDPAEKAKLQNELQVMRSVQRQASSYNQGQRNSGGLAAMGRRVDGL